MALGGVREHRLLERGERPRLDDLRRERARERDEDEQPDGAGESEDRAGEAHHDEEPDVPAAPSDPVAGTGDRERDDRGAADERAEHEPDLHAREAEVGECDADQDAAQPVGERAQSLDEQDSARVAAELHSRPASFRHHA